MDVTNSSQSDGKKKKKKREKTKISCFGTKKHGRYLYIQNQKTGRNPFIQESFYIYNQNTDRNPLTSNKHNRNIMKVRKHIRSKNYYRVKCELQSRIKAIENNSTQSKQT